MVVVYKSPTCGCCVKWADMLAEAGFVVKTKDVLDLRAIKAEFGIDRTLASCHTAIVEDRYVVEGHVPIEQVQRLLVEQPAIKGLAVPGMPVGSPGMEGPNPVPYDVLAIGEQQVTVYARVTP